MRKIEEKLNYVLELENITKIFPGVKALDGVSLRLKQGEVLALVGENGAGKSTLINCISGVFMPETGSIRIDGKIIDLGSPQDAFNNGISVVHQERNLIQTFNIAENIFLKEICGRSLKTVDRKGMIKRASSILDRVKLYLDPSGSISNLSSGQMQMIEIARALSIESHILLLDEPTASISLKEADTLINTVIQLRNEGVSIIYVSHKLEEIFSVADRVKVLRDGKSIGDEIPVSDITKDDLIYRMVGQRQQEMIKAFTGSDKTENQIVLEAIDISSEYSPNVNSFILRQGEILGWYGLVGAGRTELARAVVGIDPVTGGKIKINGKGKKIRNYKHAFSKYRIYYLSENRKEEGLFLSHSISRNISTVILDKLKNFFGLHSYKKEHEVARKFKEILKIKMGSVTDFVSSLSGGNQQKVCIAKCLVTDPEIIIFDEPTVGIDVKTHAEVHKLIYKLSQEGKSIILISSDLPEVIQLSDRILTFRSGMIVGKLGNTKDYDTMSNAVMNLMLDRNVTKE